MIGALPIGSIDCQFRFDLTDLARIAAGIRRFWMDGRKQFEVRVGGNWLWQPDLKSLYKF
jgi:hypothetical protein